MYSPGQEPIDLFGPTFVDGHGITDMVYRRDRHRVDRARVRRASQAHSRVAASYTAPLFGDRIQAAASFHGGGLVTDQPESPHLRVPEIKARIYVAGAIEDASFTEANQATLTQAFDDAHVNATVEKYQAKHGFVVRDHRVYDAASAHRHDVALEKLFSETLR